MRTELDTSVDKRSEFRVTVEKQVGCKWYCCTQRLTVIDIVNDPGLVNT